MRTDKSLPTAQPASVSPEAPHPTDAPIAVGVKRAATMLGVGYNTMHNLLMRGDVPSFFIQRRRLVRVADLRAFVDQRVDGKEA